MTIGIQSETTSLKYIVTPGLISIITEPGKAPVVIHKDDVDFDEAKGLISSSDWEGLKNLTIGLAERVKKTLSFSKGKLSFGKGGVIVDEDGNQLENYITDYVVQFAKQGVEIQPLLRFLENLRNNPSNRAQEELGKWMAKGQMSITEDGHILAYKRVKSDYKSIHDGKTDNSVGTIVEMPRGAVDDNSSRTCSHGLHFCSAEYLPHFGNGDLKSTTDKILLLKINPADVVSIPDDYNLTKGRASKYLILADVTDQFKSVTEVTTYNADNNVVYRDTDNEDVDNEDDYYGDTEEGDLEDDGAGTLWNAIFYSGKQD